MQCTQTVRAVWWVGVAVALALIMPAAPAAAETGKERLLIPSAGWHGRPIEQPIRDATRQPVNAGRAPRGWEAGPVSLGTGTHRATGSQRVREVQWRLRALGYRPGPIDGIYGPRTRAAVGWFQVKHGLTVDGRATFAVVRHLRDRTTPERSTTIDAEATAPPERPAVAAPARVVVREASTGTPLWAVLGLLLLAFALGFGLVALRQRKRPARTTGIGYVRLGGEPSRRLEAHATTIEERCADHGIALSGLVTDDAADRNRPGLEFALEQFEQGATDCLVVGRVGQSELAALLDRLAERAMPLVVLNAEPAVASGRWARPVPEVSRDA